MTAATGANHEDCVRKLKVLSDPTRLSVLKLLIEQPRNVGELIALLGLEQSLLSHHLQVLRKTGLVTSTRDGKAVLYQLSAQVRTSAPVEALDLGCCQLSFNP